MSRGERGPLNEGLPASESVAEPARSGADYDPLTSVGGTLSPWKVSIGYLHAVHPETGLEVVFVPGEALPVWAREVQRQRYQPAAAEGNNREKPKGYRAIRGQETGSEGK